MQTQNAKTGAGPIEGDGCGGSLPGLACEARELKRIITSLAQQISEADRRHSDALAKVQARLGLLGDTTQGLRARLPEQMTGVLDRIEDRMAKITDQISGSGSGSGQDGKDADKSSRAAAIAAAAAAAPPAPALRSALSVDALDAYDRSALAGRSAGQAPVDTFDVVDSKGGVDSKGWSHDAHHWDQGAADALARLYEVGMNEDGTAPALDAVTASAQAVQPSPAGRALHGSPAEIAAELAAIQSKASEGEREWLEQRFTEVAARLEQSLDGLGAGGSLEAIEHRFASLEQHITDVMGDAVKRVDLASLKGIETQVEDLNAQLYSVQSHFARLDTIELELRSLGERLSTDGLAKAFESSAAAGPDSDALAGAVASRVVQQMPKIDAALQAIASQLSSQKIADLVALAQGPAQDPGILARLVAEHVSQNMPQATAGHADPIARIDELKSMLEAFVNERRHGEEQANTMLDTMQQAMIRLLDRMDAIEQLQYAPAYEQEAEAEGRDYGEPVRVPVEHERHAEVVEPGREASHAMPARYPMQAEATIPATMQPQAPRAALPDARDVELPRHGQPIAVAETEHGQAHAAGSRDDFVAAARRAARMAADAPADAQPGRDTPVAAAKASDRDKAKKSQISPVSLALLAAVLIGGSFVAVKSTLLAPRAVAPAGAPGAAAPTPAPVNSGAAKSGSIKQAPNLEDADAPAEGSARRSSLPGMGGNDVDSSGAGGLPPDVQRQIGGAISLPAAFTKDEMPGAAAPRSTALPPVAIGPNSLRNAAAKGDPAAEFEVGARFAEGRGVPQDLQQAVSWYQRAAAQGFAPAQYRLASMYERGLGVKVDLARARVWYQRAAEGGVVKAMHNMAVLSAGRDSSLTDYQAAAKWFAAAAEYGLADSQFNLAIMLDSGLGMERDAKQAYKWFSISARAGDEEASRRRDALRAKLTPQDVSAVEAQITGWRPKSADRVLNDPRLAGEGWKTRAR